MTGEPLNKNDVQRLIELGDRMAAKLDQLEAPNMKAHAKLLNTTWWHSAKQGKELWEQYVRFMKRDSVV
jgi:hypothetical protein